MIRYKLTDETKIVRGVTVHRILWLSDNRLGGWIANPECLPQDGTAVLHDNATILDGTFRGGTFLGGTFQGGTFEVGTFLGGISCQKQPIFIAGLSWPITITDNHMTIGCQHHKLARWWKFSERQIAAMDSYATAFWKEHKEMLQALCAATGRASEGGA